MYRQCVTFQKHVITDISYNKSDPSLTLFTINLLTTNTSQSAIHRHVSEDINMLTQVGTDTKTLEFKPQPTQLNGGILAVLQPCERTLLNNVKYVIPIMDQVHKDGSLQDHHQALFIPVHNPQGQCYRQHPRTITCGGLSYLHR